MKHYDIEGQDNLGLPTYETRPSFTSEHVGKLIFESSTNKILYGSSSGWTEPGGGGSSSGIRFFNIGPWTTLNIVGISVLSINLRENWPGGEPGVGVAYVTPADCLISVHGGVGTLTYHISKDYLDPYSWQSNTDPTKCFVGFGCAQIGPNDVFIKVTDTSGQSDMLSVIVLVQDYDNICGV